MLDDVTHAEAVQALQRASGTTYLTIERPEEAVVSSVSGRQGYYVLKCRLFNCSVMLVVATLCSLSRLVNACPPCTCYVVHLSSGASIALGFVCSLASTCNMGRGAFGDVKSVEMMIHGYSIWVC